MLFFFCINNTVLIYTSIAIFVAKRNGKSDKKRKNLFENGFVGRVWSLNLFFSVLLCCRYFLYRFPNKFIFPMFELKLFLLLFLYLSTIDIDNYYYSIDVMRLTSRPHWKLQEQRKKGQQKKSTKKIKANIWWCCSCVILTFEAT